MQKGISINNLFSSKGYNTGKSVSANAEGNIIAVGSPDTYIGATGRIGYAVMYSFSGNDWVQMGDSILGFSDISNMGCSVSLNYEGTMVAIASRLDDQAGSNSGITSIYDYIGSNWVKVDSDISGQLSNELGTSVCLSSNGLRVAVGSPKDILGSSPYGLAEVYGNDNYTQTKIANNNSNIKLYPNPAKDFLYIESKLSNIKEISFIDISGKSIETINNIDFNNYRLNVSNIEKGIYFIKITTNNGISTQKIILE